MPPSRADLTFVRICCVSPNLLYMTSDNRRLDEEAPLLQRKPKTPVPWNHVSLVFVALVAEPVSSAYIFPFINQVRHVVISCSQTVVHLYRKQLIGELGITGGDDRKIGYYAGLIVSAHTFTGIVPCSSLCRNLSFS